MSSEKDRKRVNKTQGWEEAGEEFYRENYAGEFDNLPKDPTHLATLLPSKQSRTGLNRQFAGDKNTYGSTYRRRDSTINSMRRYRDSTMIRGNDVQVAMLPDLSENLIDEERTWDEIREIKAMPVTMSQKKELKAQLQRAEKLRLQGFDQFKWQQRKIRQLCRIKWKQAYSKLELWSSSLKKIEGNFGIGVATYFIFIKWLMFLNIAMFFIMFYIIILPTYFLKQPSFEDCDCEQSNATDCCSEQFMNTSQELTPVLDILQGSGWIKKTLIFYGFYNNHPYSFEEYLQTDNGTISEENVFNFDLPLAYIISVLIVYLISFIAIVKSSSQGFKEKLLECEGQFYQYCNFIFVGWDYCIHNEKSAIIKHKAIYDEVKAYLQTENIKEQVQNTSTEEKCKIITLRVVINIIIFLIFLGVGTLICFIFNYSHSILNNNELFYQEQTNLHILFFEYLTPIIIVLLNLFVPLILNKFAKFENFSPLTFVRVTIFRNLFLRLFSLTVFLSRFYFLIVEDYNDRINQCWETFIGQQIYKLFITDFVIHIIVTFFVNFLRRLLLKGFDNKFTRTFGEQNFELQYHILDIVYAQTLCWLGLFYSPFLPAIATIYFFFMFYIKKFACLVNSKPSIFIYRSSKSKFLFMSVTLLSFLIAITFVGFAISEIQPSESCGPYQGLSSAWKALKLAFLAIPIKIQSIIFFFCTTTFGIPAFITMFLILYYYNTIYSVNKHMVFVLKKQLVLEGHDKQFLLDRLSSFMKQQQEYQKQSP